MNRVRIESWLDDKLMGFFRHYGLDEKPYNHSFLLDWVDFTIEEFTNESQHLIPKIDEERDWQIQEPLEKARLLSESLDRLKGGGFLLVKRMKRCGRVLDDEEYIQPMSQFTTYYFLNRKRRKDEV